MRCEKCGFENAEDAPACSSCGLAFPLSVSVAKTPVRFSHLASLSFYSSLSVLPLFILGIFTGLMEPMSTPKITAGIAFVMLSLLMICLGFLSGLVSLIGILFFRWPRHDLGRSAWGFLLGCIYVFLLMIMILPHFQFTREKVARVKGDLRTMTIAVETYYLDNNAYPPWSVKREENIFGLDEDKKGKMARLPTFYLPDGSISRAPLTTPIAYITAFYEDPFSPVKGATFCYWGTSGESPANPDGLGYILWSAGPDGVYDLTMDNIAKLYVPKAGEMSTGLLNLTYDPSNGTKSRGDIYRTKM